MTISEVFRLCKKAQDALGPMDVSGLSKTDQEYYATALSCLNSVFGAVNEPPATTFLQTLGRWSEGSGQPTLTTIPADIPADLLKDVLAQLFDSMNWDNGSIYDVYVNGELVRTMTL